MANCIGHLLCPKGKISVSVEMLRHSLNEIPMSYMLANMLVINFGQQIFVYTWMIYRI